MNTENQDRVINEGDTVLLRGCGKVIITNKSKLHYFYIKEGDSANHEHRIPREEFYIRLLPETPEVPRLNKFKIGDFVAVFGFNMCHIQGLTNSGNYNFLYGDNYSIHAELSFKAFECLAVKYDEVIREIAVDVKEIFNIEVKSKSEEEVKSKSEEEVLVDNFLGITKMINKLPKVGRERLLKAICIFFDIET